MKTPATAPKLKENIWIEYAAISTNELPQLWKSLMVGINCPHLTKEPLLTELINEEIFEGLLNNTFKTHHTKPTLIIHFSKDEQNMLADMS